MMIRVAWTLYGLIAIAMLATSLLTGRQASALTGSPHYLLTRREVYVERRVATEDATQSALDALFEEAGEPATRTVARPMFVLGLLDATGPVILGGAAALGVLTVAVRRRRRAPQAGSAESKPV